MHNFLRSLRRSILRIPKRIRFVVSAGTLVGLMLFSTFFFFDFAWIFVPVFILCVYALTYFSIMEGVEKTEWITLFLMPVLLTVSFYLFYFLFPVRWLTRLPFMVLYGFSIYAVLLTSNIFNVGVERSLQLHRAAFSVNYFYQTLVLFLLLQVIYSFRQNFLINGLATGIVTLPLVLQLLWTARPKTQLEPQIIRYAMFVGFIMLQLSIILSLVPLKGSIYSLALTAVYYSLTGLIYHYTENKLYRQTIREYSIVISFIAIILVLSLQW